MTALVVTLLLAVSLIGHAICWIGLINRLHSTALSRPLMKAVTSVLYAVLLGIPLLFLWHGFARGLIPADTASALPWPGHALDGWHYYLLAMLFIAVVRGPVWIIDRSRHRPPAAVVGHLTDSVDIATALGHFPIAGSVARFFAHLPGNQMFHLAVEEEDVALPRLPAALADLSILHLTDFHFSRRITREYFDEVVRIANRLQPDLIAVTGDICDAALNIDWVGPIFGSLQAPLGKFFVLGNHDKRVKDVPRLRAALSAAGCIDLAAGPKRVEIRGQSVLLAGNELPWFPLADSLPAALASAGQRPFKILLTHSPDQFAWARGHDFDLVLAGHTHGGQVCLPGIGPIVCPSWHGIRYAGGTFFTPPTLMHVSRGISNLFPLRLLCPPEMTKLVLRRAAGQAV
ncbi:MAG TPA: metallophosphoesterase [Pirellulales bacterium]